jgi:hypothetical protein
VPFVPVSAQTYSKNSHCRRVSSVLVRGRAQHRLCLQDVVDPPIISRSNAGGGGERVLWVAIKALEQLCTPARGIHVVIYTGDGDATPAEILAKAKVRCYCFVPSSRLYRNVFCRIALMWTWLTRPSLSPFRTSRHESGCQRPGRLVDETLSGLRSFGITVWLQLATFYDAGPKLWVHGCGLGLFAAVCPRRLLGHNGLCIHVLRRKNSRWCHGCNLHPLPHHHCSEWCCCLGSSCLSEARALCLARCLALRLTRNVLQDMLSRVYERRPTYNNSETVASSALATYAKVV